MNMAERKTKLYIRLTIIFTLIFALIAGGVFAAVWMQDWLNSGFDFGDDDSTMETAYVNTLLCGVDEDGYRTDVLIFAQYNLMTNQINMVQIPRDTYVQIGKTDRKINSAYGYNKEEELFKQVEYILDGVNVDRYVMVDFQGFRDIIDAIGGVEYDVPINMNYDDPVQDLHIHLEKGQQTLDGAKAEMFVRFRQNNDGTGYPMGDTDRVKAQTGFIYAAIDQITSVQNVLKLPKLISIATENVKTNFSTSEMMKYAPMVLKLGRENINIMQLEGEPRYMMSPYGYELSYFLHDEDKTAQMVQQYFTPAAEEISARELEIRDKLIGDDSQRQDVDTAKAPKKQFFNWFVKVDILDGSDGTADIDAVVEAIESYGYKVSAVNQTNGVVYPETLVIAKKDNGNGDAIAQAIGMDSFLINPDKGNGTNVTIILGKDLGEDGDTASQKTASSNQ